MIFNIADKLSAFQTHLAMSLREHKKLYEQIKSLEII